MTAQNERSGEDDGTGARSPTADTVLEDILTSPCAASGGGDVYMARRVTETDRRIRLQFNHMDMRANGSHLTESSHKFVTN